MENQKIRNALIEQKKELNKSWVKLKELKDLLPAESIEEIGLTTSCNYLTASIREINFVLQKLPQ